MNRCTATGRLNAVCKRDSPSARYVFAMGRIMGLRQ